MNNGYKQVKYSVKVTMRIEYQLSDDISFRSQNEEDYDKRNNSKQRKKNKHRRMKITRKNKTKDYY